MCAEREAVRSRKGGSEGVWGMGCWLFLGCGVRLKRIEKVAWWSGIQAGWCGVWCFVGVIKRVVIWRRNMG